MGNGEDRDLFKTFLSQLVKLGEFATGGQRRLEDLIRWLQVPIARPDFVTVLDLAARLDGEWLVRSRDITIKRSQQQGRVRVHFDAHLTSIWAMRFKSIPENFLELFGDMDCVKTGEVKLGTFHLLAAVGADQIGLALDRAEASVCLMSDIYHVLKAQPAGELGSLNVAGLWNGFLVRDRTGYLRLIRLRWTVAGWELECYDTRVARCPEGMRMYGRIK